jgi:hypothetical protein
MTGYMLLFQKDETLLEAEEFAELPEFMLLLPVSARLKDVSELNTLELMRLMPGEGVDDLEPSSSRVVRRCSCRVRSDCCSVLCLLRINLSRSELATVSAKLICGSPCFFFQRPLGWPSLQGLGSTPALTISAKVGDRGRGVEEETFWRKYEFTGLSLAALGESRLADPAPSWDRI